MCRLTNAAGQRERIYLGRVAGARLIPELSPRPERIGGTVSCDRGKRMRIIISLPRVERDAFVEAYQPYRCGTKEESNTSNFNDGNGARRSRDPGWCGSLGFGFKGSRL